MCCEARLDISSIPNGRPPAAGPACVWSHQPTSALAKYFSRCVLRCCRRRSAAPRPTNLRPAAHKQLKTASVTHPKHSKAVPAPWDAVRHAWRPSWVGATCRIVSNTYGACPITRARPEHQQATTRSKTCAPLCAARSCVSIKATGCQGFGITTASSRAGLDIMQSPSSLA